jgi:hypothetical protein
VLLRREGEASGINRIYRLYREEGLAVRKRSARRKAVGSRAPILVEARPNARWSLDFVHDQLACGRRFRILNVVDDVTRECLAAIPDTSITGRRVARELTAVIERRGRPGMIVSDNGTELTSNAILTFAAERGIEWHYIAPGKPLSADCFAIACRAMDAERLRGEFQRADARRTTERDDVPGHGPCPRCDPRLGYRLQRGETPLSPQIPDAQGVRRGATHRNRQPHCAT